MNTSDAQIVAQALAILSRDLRRPGCAMSSPERVKSFLTLHLAAKEHEVFGAIWLDVKNTMIVREDLFSGTLAHAAVYPREVVKAALKHNAAGLICYHNHPSGQAQPSDADLRITRALTQALSLVDVRLLDHVIVGGMDTYSFAEHGLI